METRIGGDTHLFHGMGSADLRAAGKRSLEWDPNGWKWDGDLFIASPLIYSPLNYQSRQFFPLGSGIPVTGGSSNSSTSCSDEANIGIEKGKRELEKRGRVIVVEDDNLDDEAGNLSLKVGGHGSSVTEREVGIWDRTSGKKTKLLGTTSNPAVCQVEDCQADLSNSKDYHRRHKVCEMHSKASGALVGNVLQRFCQQCSRFHVLQEFDEGKRSCRRRLAGHNKRRRKTQPDNVVNSSSLNDDQASGYLLITLLRILSNMHSNSSTHTNDEDLLSHLLSSLANHGGLHGDKNISGLLQESRNLLNDGPTIGNSEIVLASHDPQGPPGPNQQHLMVSVSEMAQKGVCVHDARDEDLQTTSSHKPAILFPIKDSPAYSEARDSSARQNKLNHFDLNYAYIGSDDCTEDLERSPNPVDLGTGSLDLPSWVQQDSHQSSPPQTSGNSDSVSAHSPSSSGGDAQAFINQNEKEMAQLTDVKAINKTVPLCIQAVNANNNISRRLHNRCAELRHERKKLASVQKSFQESQTILRDLKKENEQLEKRLAEYANVLKPQLIELRIQDEKLLEDYKTLILEVERLKKRIAETLTTDVPAPENVPGPFTAD